MKIRSILVSRFEHEFILYYIKLVCESAVSYIGVDEYF